MKKMLQNCNKNEKIFIDFQKIFIEFLQATKTRIKKTQNDIKFHNLKHEKKFYFITKKL